VAQCFEQCVCGHLATLFPANAVRVQCLPLGHVQRHRRGTSDIVRLLRAECDLDSPRHQSIRAYTLAQVMQARRRMQGTCTAWCCVASHAGDLPAPQERQWPSCPVLLPTPAQWSFPLSLPSCRLPNDPAKSRCSHSPTGISWYPPSLAILMGMPVTRQLCIHRQRYKRSRKQALRRTVLCARTLLPIRERPSLPPCIPSLASMLDTPNDRERPHTLLTQSPQDLPCPPCLHPSLVLPPSPLWCCLGGDVIFNCPETSLG
jgi:hypothetical protein